MKIIDVIVPVNNQRHLNEQDLLEYQSNSCHFRLSYVNSRLTQLVTANDIDEVIPLVQDNIDVALKQQTNGIIVYGFGDVGIIKEQEQDTPPIFSTGRLTIRQLAKHSRDKFTILPLHESHAIFIEDLVKQEGLIDMYAPAPKAVGIAPSQVRTNPSAIDKVLQAANLAIQETGIDCFSVGCTSFYNLAKNIEQQLFEHLNKSIYVLEPGRVSLLSLKERVTAI